VVPPPARRPTVAPSALLASLALLGVLVATGLWLVGVGEANREVAERGRVTAEAATVLGAFEGELNATIHLARGVRGFAVATPEAADPDHPTGDRLRGMLAAVFEDATHLRNMGVAPDDQIRYVHPLEGNEEALGLRYVDLPDQVTDVRRARVTRGTVMSGPLELVQGGRGLVVRTPVFLPDQTYWGLVSLVVDVPSLVAAVEEQVADTPVRWAARARSSTGALPAVAGDQALFADPDAVLLAMDVPQGSWELAALPGGELVDVGLPARLQRAGVVLVSLVIAGLVLAVLEERRRIRALSIHDPLTHLPNRRLLEDRLGHAIQRAVRDGRGFALLYLDLDGFKPVNDRLGHAAGDTVLRTVAERLDDAVRPGDTVARVGGDEFVILLADVHDEPEIRHSAERIVTALRAPVHVADVDVVVTTSVGAARFPEDGTSVEDLLAAADGAMYEAKRDADTDVTLSTGHPLP